LARIARNDILEAARAIRPYLADLLGPEGQDTAEAIDRDLAAGLVRAREGEDAEEDVAAVLADHPVTRNWAARFLELGYPPSLAPLSERAIGTGYAPPPGSGVVSAARFSCPEGDYVWFQRTVGTTPPACPTHSVALVPE
jgi:hypothetical protein